MMDLQNKLQTPMNGHTLILPKIIRKTKEFGLNRFIKQARLLTTNLSIFWDKMLLFGLLLLFSGLLLVIIFSFYFFDSFILKRIEKLKNIYFKKFPKNIINPINLN